jgi:hypothetical protein
MNLPIETSKGWFTCSLRREIRRDPQSQAPPSLHPVIGTDRHLTGPGADAMQHDLGTHGRLARLTPSSPSMKSQPQFLRIQWEDTPEQGQAVTLTATLCLRHRGEIALAYASTRGSGELGDAWDLCEGRSPRPPS